MEKYSNWTCLRFNSSCQLSVCAMNGKRNDFSFDFFHIVWWKHYQKQESENILLLFSSSLLKQKYDKCCSSSLSLGNRLKTGQQSVKHFKRTLEQNQDSIVQLTGNKESYDNGISDNNRRNNSKTKSLQSTKTKVMDLSNNRKMYSIIYLRGEWNTHTHKRLSSKQWTLNRRHQQKMNWKTRKKERRKNERKKHR